MGLSGLSGMSGMSGMNGGDDGRVFDPPTDFHAEPNPSLTELIVTWTPPADPPTAYTFEVKRDIDESWTSLGTTDGPTSSWWLPLPWSPPVTVSVRMRAVYDDGVSAWVEVSDILVALPPATSVVPLEGWTVTNNEGWAQCNWTNGSDYTSADTLEIEMASDDSGSDATQVLAPSMVDATGGQIMVFEAAANYFRARVWNSDLSEVSDWTDWVTA